jgi:transposase-like protein
MSEKPEANEPQCPHTALTSHWQEPKDMGKAELATYTCESCGQTFPYAQAQQYLNKPPAALTAVASERRELDDERSR